MQSLLQIIKLILILCSDGRADAFQLVPSYPTEKQKIKCTRQLNKNLLVSANNNDYAAGDDNKAMAFLRKVGRVGGAANMDFATAMGLDESPSGGSKSSYHGGGFKVSYQNRMLLFCECIKVWNIFIYYEIGEFLTRQRPIYPECTKIECSIHSMHNLRYHRRHVRSFPLHKFWLPMAGHY